MNNIMLDLETLDTNKSAVIVSIGAVYFDDECLGDSFYMVCSLNGMSEQVKRGRTISPNTISWWMQQSEDVRNVFVEKNHQHINMILNEFIHFLGRYKTSVNIWGNGSDFDNVILADCYKSFNYVNPWKYSKNRCYRTIKNTFVGVELKRVGEHHNALDDAKSQALHLIEILKIVTDFKYHK